MICVKIVGSGKVEILRGTMNKQFLFSIIMPIYNVDKWLEEAIESIITQEGVCFEDDVQLILVNDCSPDNSESICLQYKKKYSNIIYIKNPKNLKLSNTRNQGLKYATGRYINFCDPDDILSNNVLYEVKSFFEACELEGQALAHVSIPLVFFEGKKGLHPKYKQLGKSNRVIDLSNEGYNFILSSASSFYPRDFLLNEGVQFDPSLFGEEDTLFNFELYKRRLNIGFVTENNVVYHYRQRKEGGSQVNQSFVNPKAFHTPIQLLEKVGIDKASELYYELCIYELRSRLKIIKPEIFSSIEEYEWILDKYRSFIKDIPASFIINETKWLTDFSHKITFLTNVYNESLSLNEQGLVCKKNIELFKINKLPIDIKEMYIKNNTFIIETIVNNYDISDIYPILQYNDEYSIYPVVSKAVKNSAYVEKIGNINSQLGVLYSRFEIPVFKIGVYKFYFKRKSNNHIHVVERLKTYSESSFLGNGVFGTDVFKIYSNLNTSITLFNKAIYINKTKIYDRFINRLKVFNIIRKKHKVNKWLRLAKLPKAKYWLFNDRPINANDNAEYFFEYINKNHKSIAKNCYFILDKNSPDINRISKIGNVVIHNSFQHKYLYLNAKYIFTSHLALNFFKPFPLKFLKYYNDLFDAKIIWLQHGVTMNDISSAANKFYKHVDKIVVSTKFESEIFSQDKYFYQKNDILEVGFPRHDKLNKIGSNNILIMPTWRSELSGKILPNGLHAEKEGFVESDYYLNYAKLLSSKKLLEFLKHYNFKLKFILHPGFKQYVSSFKKFANSHIEIVDKKSFSYNKLFNQSSLLITDYSSVFFDFSYSGKPCLFFQFDRESFYLTHYKKGNFDFDTMAPGEVLTDIDSLIQKICELLASGCQLDKKHMERILDMYRFTDRQNCERLLLKVL